MRAVDANPDDPSLLLDLGITLGKAGMMPQAETRLQLAATANPRDPRPWFWLGLAQMEEGKKAEARESFTRFLALAPSRYDRQIGMARDRLAQLQ
jgi:Flp pilus assembly protein TadD